MPKRARHLLIWSGEDQRYELREEGSSIAYLLREDDGWWLDWLAEHTALAFRGRQGHLNLLKEKRARGTDYWYAYRHLSQGTRKQYAGRTADLTVAHLEKLAGSFLDKGGQQVVVAEIPQDSGAGEAPAQTQISFPPQALPAEPTSLEQGELLLETKLRPPRVPAVLVERERLFARLDAGRESRLTILCAPAGFGKTTLAGQWLQARRVDAALPVVAWVSLDSGDNDPARFWRYIIAACQRFQPDVGRASLEQLIAPPLELPSLEKLLTPLLNELMRSESAGLLVLEDYHLITEARLHETVSFFLEHLPATLRVLLLTRSEPPFPLVQWRARGEVCDVQAAELRFSLEETAQFFQQFQADEPLVVSAEELQQLEERVEGWAAGLRLLALALQGSAPRQSLIQALAHFAGDQRALQGYFVAEVLDAQSEEMQNFLLRTSVLERLSGELCNAVAERQDSERMLEAIERAGLFLEALNGSGQWYRYHALFAEAMRAEARRRLGAESLRMHYQRASVWYEQQKMLAEAIEAAFQAQDLRRAAVLIERLLERPATILFGPQSFQQLSEFQTLRGWLEQLPEELLRARPLLSLGYAAALVFRAAQEQVPPAPAMLVRLFGALQEAEDAWRREGDLARLGEIYAFRAMVLKEPVVFREALQYARQALELLPVDADESRVMVLWLIGMGEVQAGHLNAAREALLQVRTYCELLGNGGILRANTVWLSGLDYAQGEWRQAGATCRQLLAEARAIGDLDDVCDALLGLAQLAYGWNDLKSAEEQAQEALELARQLTNGELQMQATLILVLIERARGQYPAAQQRCAELLAQLPTALPQSWRLVRELQATQALLALAQGDLAAVERWWKSRAEAEELPVALRETEALLWVRWHLAQGQANAALKRLEAVHEAAQTEGRSVRAWESQVLLAQVHAMLKNVPQAQKLLREVIERVHIEGAVRLFLDEGEGLATLLLLLVPAMRNEAQRAFLRRLLVAFAQERARDGQPQSLQTMLAESLSAQEQRVLHLLAAGRTNPEIGRELVVSINTVKAHVQSIYRKLNVKNRVEASEAARMLELV